jgi:proteasome lid subunit RPN8/RPN11
MAIIITERQFNKIIKHCTDSYPAEAGGFLGGKGNVILGIFPIPNLAFMRFTEKEQFFWADWDILKVHTFFDKYDLNVLGFYHSHPTSELPVPSHNDIQAHQVYHLKIMMIISLADLKSTKAAAFLVDSKVKSENLTVIKDNALNKYLLKFDIKESADKYIQEMQKLEKRVGEIVKKFRKEEKE